MPVCEACGQEGAPKRCSRCMESWYCSIACQRKHWKAGHKHKCVQAVTPSAATAAAKAAAKAAAAKAEAARIAAEEAAAKVEQERLAADQAAKVERLQAARLQAEREMAAAPETAELAAAAVGGRGQTPRQGHRTVIPKRLLQIVERGGNEVRPVQFKLYMRETDPEQRLFRPQFDGFLIGRQSVGQFSVLEKDLALEFVKIGIIR